MKSFLSTIVLFLISLPVYAATQEPTAPPEIEPLGIGYILFLVTVVVLILAGFWWYYSRPEPEEDESKQLRD